MMAGGGVAPAAPPSDSRREQWRGAALIAGIGLLVMVPEFALGPGFTDSFRYNHAWTEQFTRALGQGELWPRWLDESWYGFGSPTFYFYPPMFFWIAGAVRALSAGMLNAGATASLTSALVLVVSGLAMRAWLRTIGGERTALVGALAYMLAPYHLYDIACRGALAEACVYALLPLVMLGLRRASVPLVAAASAGLLLAHLPVALLAGLSAIPTFAIFTASTGGSARALASAMVGGLIGAGLAAAYWLPALALLPYVSTGALGGSYYRPEIWFFWRPQDWPGGLRMIAIVAITLGWLAVALGGRVTREGRLWLAVTAFGAAIVAGVLPWVWQLPIIAQVQFPWRLLVVVEFAAITAFVAGGARREAVASIGAALLAIGWAIVATVATAMLAAGVREGNYGRALVSRGYEEAPEYLPAGFPIPLDREGRADPGNIPLPRHMAAAIALDPRARLAIGGDRIAVDAPSPTRIVARHFAFPRWRVTCDGVEMPTLPYGRERLISWQAPAGVSRCVLETRRTPSERIGLAISAVAMALWLVFAGYAVSQPLPFGRRKRER